mgnify:CR=1 FL=1
MALSEFELIARYFDSPDFAVPDAEGVPYGAVPVASHDHVTAVIPAGTVSVIVAPVTFDGPRFVTVTVYVTAAP